MKSRITRLFIVVSFLCAVIGCERDDVDNEGDVIDGYGSDLTISLPANFSDKFPLESITCEVRTAASEEVLITAKHVLMSGESMLIFDEALPMGSNILRSVRYVGEETTRGGYSEVPLGCTINVGRSSNSLYPSVYDKLYGLFGDGTAKNPYQIASAINFAAINKMDDTNYYFEQAGPIDFLPYYGHEFGFEGVCPDSNRPFRGIFTGGGEKNPIKNLAVRRYSAEEEDSSRDDLAPSSPVGLFSCVSGAIIKNIHLDNPDLSGDESVGGIVGAILGVSGTASSSTVISNCHLIRTSENGNRLFGATSVGGIVGCVEYLGSMTVENCSVAKELILSARSAEYGGGAIGGIIGSSGQYASTVISGCVNDAPIIGDGLTCMGGIIGTAEVVKMMSCVNNAEVTQRNGTSDSFATGGLIGGATSALIIGSENNGVISGTRGVGGIVGSSIYDTSAETAQFGDVVLVSTHNNGAVSGTQSVGGLVGEAQVSLTNCLNNANVFSTSVPGVSYEEPEVGGLVGYGSFMVASNSHNLGLINGSKSGGLAGVAEYFFVYGCSNFANVTGDITGGLIGETSEYGLLNYAINFADVSGSGNTGGLIGSLGEQISMSDKLATYGKDVVKDFVFCAVKLATEGAAMGIEEWCAKGSHHVWELVVGHVPMGWEIAEIVAEIIEVVELDAEKHELCEELEEIPERMESMVSDAMSDMDSKMDRTLDGKINSGAYKYRGDMNISQDISKIAFNNMRNFCHAIKNDTSTDPESYLFSNLTVNSHKALSERGSDVASAAYTRELTAAILKCAIAFGGMFAIGAFEVYAAATKVLHAVETVKKLKVLKFGMLGGSLVGSLAIDAGKDLSEDAENAIIVSQGMNFGACNGNGLIGMIGDRVEIRNCLSAGKADGYSVAGSADNKNLYDSNVLCIGKANQDPYSDKGVTSGYIYNFYCYGDGRDGTYTASELGMESTYETGDDETKWSWDLWTLDQGGVPLPSNSPYLSFY